MRACMRNGFMICQTLFIYLSFKTLLYIITTTYKHFLYICFFNLKTIEAGGREIVSIESTAKNTILKDI